MAPLILLVVGGDKELPDFRDAVEACKAAGPLKLYTATKAVEAASQLNVRFRGSCKKREILRRFGGSCGISR